MSSEWVSDFNLLFIIMRTSIIALIVSLISSAITAGAVSYVIQPKDNLIAEYYAVENAVQISPHGLRKKIETYSNTSIIVDLRSEEEYREEHIK